MSDFWRFDNLERVTGGRWLRAPADPSAAATGLSHDTRTLTPGQVYLAVKGENHDGQRFVGAAFDAGASLAIVDDAWEAADVNPRPERESPPAADSHPRLPGPAVLAVPDTVAALQDLASAYRDVLANSGGGFGGGGCKVIAVCGSNGKTTTRHLLHHVLTSCGLVGTQSPKSFNNHLGVPLTLLAAQPDHDFVACEIGTNHPGEIAGLGEIAWPDAAIITSIGKEHLEFFKSLDGVAKEEASIMRFVRPNGLVTLPADAAEKVMPYYDVQDGVVFLPIADASGIPQDFPLLGEHNRMNAALAAAVARWLDLDAGPVAAAWRSAEPPEGRLRRLSFGQGVTVIDDSYNANPDSMRVALDCLAESSGRKVAFLGEMLELGECSLAEHGEIGRYAVSLGIDFVCCIGTKNLRDMFITLHSRPPSPPNRNGAYRAIDVDDALDHSGVEQIFPGDTVLLKGSRGMALERIIPAIEAKFGKA